MFFKYELQLLCLSVFLQSATCVAAIAGIDKETLKTQIKVAIREGQQVEVLLFIQQKSRPKFTQNERNEFLERAILDETSLEMARHLLNNNESLKANQLGMNDILRMATSRGLVDKVRFVLFDILEGQLQASEEAIAGASIIAKERGSQAMIDLFTQYASLH
ncbi:MAG: hypothetical protein WCJ92_08315 [Alphaproteobacteria bacterium]